MTSDCEADTWGIGNNWHLNLDFFGICYIVKIVCLNRLGERRRLYSAWTFDLEIESKLSWGYIVPILLEGDFVLDGKNSAYLTLESMTTIIDDIELISDPVGS